MFSVERERDVSAIFGFDDDMLFERLMSKNKKQKYGFKTPSR